MNKVNIVVVVDMKEVTLGVKHTTRVIVVTKTRGSIQYTSNLAALSSQISYVFHAIILTPTDNDF